MEYHGVAVCGVLWGASGWGTMEWQCVGYCGMPVHGVPWGNSALVPITAHMAGAILHTMHTLPGDDALRISLGALTPCISRTMINYIASTRESLLLHSVEPHHTAQPEDMIHYTA